MKIDKPGIYCNFPEADYFADPAPQPSLTQSIAKIMLEQSPLHAWAAHPRLGKAQADDDDSTEKYDKAKAIGNAAHRELIGRGKEIAVGDFDSWRGKEAAAFKAAAIDKSHVPILAEHHGAALALAEATRAQLGDAGWTDCFTQGEGEVVLAWSEGEGDDKIWLRTMIDWMVTPQVLYDLKTSAGSFAPHAIAYKIDDDGWDVQAAMHERALAVLDPDGRGRRTFRFIAQEQKPPYAMVPVELTEHHLALGRRKLAVAINLWRACMKAKRWPGYPAEPIRPEVNPFREKSWIEREVRMVDAGQWSLDDPIMLGAPLATDKPLMEAV